MHAYCITGGTNEDRMNKEKSLCQEWKVQPFDILRIHAPEEKQSVGIAEIRMLTHNLSLSPRQSPFVVGIIDQSECLTPEAQNALLKTLEEPPPRARIILETHHTSLLLPTVISRCHIIQLSNQPSVSQDDKEKIRHTIQSLSGKKPGELCHAVDQLFTHKEEKIGFLNTFLHILHTQLTHVPKKEKNREEIKDIHEISCNIRAVIKAQKQLSAHVHSALVFDAFFLTITLYKPQSLVYN
ncbi:MAG: polymerase III, delta prime subunit protein [Candidatus Gottesmanbacteria bacterium GW2011_GWA2_44_17]|uniref:Polymerase III, delta prime subunit protein n=3 Tax=Candidatus Gottesmaniibacteriota TaxID=1752720 RepID=A0A0G1LNJ0_9BACT|nr:MAG: polymerase III, delta prime subunit protein [Microgenomates group bacterium GW2011_GWC1_43_11]KKT37999.1 MAG: polymerase III, delta prime subunit protein [Candidatus Gottesmanbacteria bacterium GW2011_GWB1_44_11c]KKT47726.1 MAG: polymerase III, delta prime subunit protein [Candidatus Gottesmanbacteria bacterium GW2011_GWA2_44_17]KKT61454.1 MAG: polymerase III, delta prime subunit protein [Candidatus Gottesmanbacteria bacterium GW2011_GWA1_44_24b]HCM82703.1 hypothetical protein [Patescib